MKRFFVCAAVFAAIFLIIGCGGSSDKKLEGEKCEMSEGKDVFACDGAVVLMCVDEKWIKSEECAEGKTCNAETGKCEGGENSSECGNKTVEEGEVCDGDTKECSAVDSNFTIGTANCKSDCSGYDTTECKSLTLSNSTTGCAKIADCFWSGSNDPDACIKGDGESLFNAFYGCLVESYCNQLNCVACSNEFKACFGEGSLINTNCPTTYNCIVICGEDYVCQDTCKSNATQEGKALVDAIFQCSDTCAGTATSQEEYDNCVTTTCTDELAACK